MINQITIVGKLTRDPEVKEIKPGMTVARLSIVTTHIIKRKDGETAEEVCFIDCSLWNKEAMMVRNLRKGAEIMVAGRLKQEKWIDAKTQLERTRHTIHVTDVIHSDKLEDEIDTEEQIAAIPARQPQRPVVVAKKAAPIEEDYSDSDSPF